MRTNLISRPEFIGPIGVTFDRPTMAGMETLALVHEGSVASPVVAGAASRSTDRTVLTLRPASPLELRMSV